MSDAARREWGFYIDDMIGFAEKVIAYTQGLDQDGFVGSGPRSGESWHDLLPNLREQLRASFSRHG
jgi:hypothetical protein